MRRNETQELRLELQQNWCERAARSSGSSMSASERLVATAPPAALPEPFAGWFTARGWQPACPSAGAARRSRRGARHAADRADRRRQDAGRLPAEPGRSRPPPGEAKAGEPPSTRSMSRRSRRWPSTSPAIWRRRSREMGLPIRLETRTGDTPPSRRARQRMPPPDILLTTPEQIALMLSHKGARRAVRPAQISSFSMSCTRWPPASAAICWRSIWRGCARCRAGADRDRPVGHRGAALRACAPFSCRIRARARRGWPRSWWRARAAPRRHHHPRLGRRAALGRPLGALRAAGDLRRRSRPTACR